MFPVISFIGTFPISSLGVFLVLGLFYSIFLVWRLARAFDFDEEKVLDIAFATAVGAFLMSRVYFVLSYISYFSQDLGRAFLIFKYPGFSFWGAFLGGWLTIYYVTKRFKLDFAQVVDIAAVGFLGSLIFGNIGCFFGGCGVGVLNNSFLAVSMVGSVGKRFPVQALEAVALGLTLLKIWPQAIHFHTPGKIASKVLITVGIIKFFTEFLRASNQSGQFFALVLVALGITIFYKYSKMSFTADLKSLLRTLKLMVKDGRVRKVVLHNIFTSCYNILSSSLNDTLVSWRWRFRNFKKVLRRFNVKSTPKND